MEYKAFAMKELSFQRKVRSPSLSPTVLYRPRLVNMLNEAVHRLVASAKEKIFPYQLILLCAPAGYGKTTLLADFASHTTIPCCWCFLEHSDADLTVFLKLIVTSICQCFPQFGASLDARLARAIADELTSIHLNVEDLVESLTQAIAAEISEPFALILCHYHDVSSNEMINNLLNLLMQSLPPQCILILESRAIPFLNLTPLLVRQEIFGLGSQELRFTPQEISELVQLLNKGPISEREIMRLERTFEGWIAGIILSTYLGNLQPIHMPVVQNISWGGPAIPIMHDNLFAYLITEVFHREPEAYAFLKEAVILKRMTPETCNKLLDTSNAAERLNYLEYQGLFVVHYVQDLDSFYVCHPMLRELLYERLKLKDPARFQALHLKAMELFQETGDYDQAIFHSLSAQSYEQAAALIERTRQQVLTSGYFATFASWIDELPQEIVVRHPGLLLARATIFLSTGEYEAAKPLLDQVSAVSREYYNAEPSLEAELLITHGAMLFQQGDYQAAHELCKQALILAPEDDLPLCAEAHLRLGLCFCLQGKFQDGITALQRALLLRDCEKATRQTARLHSALASAYQHISHLVLSEHHQMRAMQCWEQLADEWGKLDSMLGLGIIRVYQCAYAEAEQIFTEVLAAARGPIRYRSIEAYVLVNLGGLYLDQNRYQEALNALGESLSLSRQLKDTYLISSTLCELATTYSLLGDPQAALVLLSPLAQVPPTGYVASSYQITHGTILLHLHSYKEASVLFKQAEVVLRASGMQSQRIRVLIRLACCELAQNNLHSARQYVDESLALAGYCGYELLYQFEMLRAPHLMQAFRKMPGTTHLYAFLDEKNEPLQHSSRPARLPVTVSSPSSTPIQSSSSTDPLLPAKPGTLPGRTTVLRVLALGETAVYLNDILITRWRLTCAMESFFFLLNAERAVHKEQIIDALWPEGDAQADQLLRSAIYHLRKLLGNSCIISSASTYRLNLTAANGDFQVWYDVAVFRQSYATGLATLAKGDEALAIRSFEEAVNLYQGDYVPSFFNDWCRSLRHELRSTCIDAHHQLALIAWRDQRLEECIVQWQRMLALDQCLEEAHCWLMRCYIQQGKRGMALRQYHRCIAALQDELNIRPGHEIQEVYQQIVQE